MKKELKKGNKKLTLGKMAVAKLNQQQMRFFYGGIDTINGDDTTKDATKLTLDQPTGNSFVDGGPQGGPCGGPKPIRTSTP